MLDQHTESPRQVFLRYSALAVTLPIGAVKVGRGPDCFICLDDPGVSRVHFQIDVGNAVVIEDLGSKNGTRVNGERISGRRRLEEGDEIAVGQRVFVVGFGTPVEPEDEVTPPETGSRATLQGVGAVDLGERCPRCREKVPFGATICATCSYEWPRGSRRTPTRQQEEACRRHDRRFPVSIPARFASSRWEGQGEILNLSLSGAFFSSEGTESVGTSCVLEVRGDKQEMIALNGVVRHAIHRGDRGMGIEFIDLGKAARDWVRRRLAQ